MTITYFGYGSLVNVGTLAEGATAVPGCLSGWVREWRIWGTNQIGRGVCTLSVGREEGSEIRGVLVTEPKEGLPALEKREHKYDAVHGIGGAFAHDHDGSDGPQDMFLFKSKPEYYGWGDDDHPVLQSYIDCVLQGFHAHWGEAGVRHFLETTRGWHVPVLYDREAPIYPRAIKLEARLREMIDDLLADLKVRHLHLS